jgi:hypothetical protein
MNGLNEGQKVSFDLITDRKSGKASAGNLRTLGLGNRTKVSAYRQELWFASPRSSFSSRAFALPRATCENCVTLKT